VTYFQTLTGALGSALAYITGSQAPGQVLTAVLVPSAGTATSWQWTLNGTNISGQTAQTYTVLSTDPGQVIGVKINGGAFTASVSIPAIPPVFSAAPVITSATTTGITFTAATLSNAGTPRARSRTTCTTTASCPSRTTSAVGHSSLATR
jgi:hypothetical protein